MCVVTSLKVLSLVLSTLDLVTVTDNGLHPLSWRACQPTKSVTAKRGAENGGINFVASQMGLVSLKKRK